MLGGGENWENEAFGKKIDGFWTTWYNRDEYSGRADNAPPESNNIRDGRDETQQVPIF